MTNAELIRKLQSLPQDAQVFLAQDWLQLHERKEVFTVYYNNSPKYGPSVVVAGRKEDDE